MTRILLRDLAPGAVYALQLRSIAGDEVSDWSRTFTITTSADTVAPSTPTGVAGSMSGSTFILTWNTVTTSSDGSAANDLDHYEVLVASSGSASTRVYNVTNTRFEFSFSMNTALFGSPQPNVQMSVRAVDRVGNASPYTSVVSQTNAAPATPTGLVASGLTNAITASWNPNTEDDLAKYVAHVGTTSGFTPVPGTKVWEGTATQFTYSTVQYSTDLYVKVYAMDIFGQLSATPATSLSVRPLNPVSVDSTAPAVPTGLAITLSNATDGKSANAAVSWTAVTDTDNDLSEYIIDFKPSSASDWQTVKVDYTKTSTRIDGLLPYTNYDFRIRSSDFSANLSAWSSTVTKTATTNAAPAVPTGLAMTAAKDNIQLSWNENTEVDMINNAGTYDVTVATNSTFTTGVLQYRTGNTTLAVNGLATNTTYWARVRATDSGGLSSAYSASVNQTTSNFPSTALSDGSVPSGAPTVTATGGIGYIYLTWTPVTNADPVIYDVYMSTTNGFTTYDATTKITEVSGTSAIIDTTVAGASIVYGTTYYFKVRARDRDGSSATISAQASAAPNKAGTSDISTIDASLITSGTSFTTNLFIGSGGAIQSTGYTAGTTGFRLSNTGLIIEGAGNTVSASALKAGTVTATTINIGATGVLNIDSTGVVKSNNYAAGSTGYQLSNTGLEINDGSIDAKVMKTNTAFITDLIMGRSADALGTIRSFDYSAGTAGWKIGKGLFEINQGTVRAAAVQIQSGASNLEEPQYSAFELTPSFYTGKFSLANATASIQTSGGVVGSQYLRIAANTAAASSCIVGDSATDYHIAVEPGKTYILSAWIRVTGTINASTAMRFRYGDGSYGANVYQTLTAGGAWARYSWTQTVPAGQTTAVVQVYNNSASTAGTGLEVDGIMVEQQVGGLTTPSTYVMPGTTSIDGAFIRTGEIRSTTNVTVNGNTQPAWSINMSGGAQFGNAAVRGSLIVGTTGDPDAGQSFIASGNYVSRTTGWKIDSSGNVDFNGGNIRGSLIVEGTLETSKLAIGVIRTNPINNPGFEEDLVLTNLTDPNQGNVSSWRKFASTNAAVSRDQYQANSGSYKGTLTINPTTGTTSDIADLFTSTILLQAGKTYTVSFSAVGTGTGMSAGGKLYLDALFGPTQTTINTSNAVNQSLSAETVTIESPPGTFTDVTNAWLTLPYAVDGSVLSTDYKDYQITLDIPAGQSDLWCTLRFRNTGNAANSKILLDDVAVIQQGIGGGAEMTSAGLRLFNDLGEETLALVSNRPNYLTIQGANNNAVASIDPNGVITGVTLNTSGDGTTNAFDDSRSALIVGGEDFADRMERSPQGVVQQVYKSALVSVTNIRTEYGIYEVGFTAQPKRHYRITFSGGTIRANTGAPTVIGLVRIRRTVDGSTPSITNGTIVRSQWVGLPTNNVDVSVPSFSLQGEVTGGSSVPVDVRLLYTLNALNAGATDWISFSNKGGTSAPAPIEVLVEDLGWDVPDGYQANNGGGTLYTGGTTTEPSTPPPASKKTYTSTWTSNSYQSRRGVSVYGNYTINTSAPSGYGLAGYYSSSNGNQYTYIGFTGSNSTGGETGKSISSAISGASVSKVELYIRNSTFYANAGGQQRFGMTTMTGQPSSGAASAPPSSGFTSNISFSTGEGKWVTLSATALSYLTGGGRIAIVGPGTSSSNTYYSKWYMTGTYVPKLRITYTK